MVRNVNYTDSFIKLTGDISSSTIKQIAVGQNLLALDDLGRIWEANSINQYFQLTNENENISNNIIDQIVSGENHYIALDNSGNLWCKGDNHEGQLGLGHNDNKDQWQMVSKSVFNGNNIKQIHTWKNSTGVLDSSGNIWICGQYGNYNNDANGDNEADNSNIFIKISDGEINDVDIKQFSIITKLEHHNNNIINNLLIVGIDKYGDIYSNYNNTFSKIIIDTENYFVYNLINNPIRILSGDLLFSYKQIINE